MSTGEIVKAAGEAGVALARSHPAALGFMVITLAIIIGIWEIRREERKAQHAELSFMLERCLPASRPEH